MSIEGILVGLLAIGAGAAWAFYGLRFFAILLPIWAFFFGLTAGIAFAGNIFSDGAIGTILSWGIGLVFGIVLAAISFFWYYAAVTIAVGALGYMLGAGFVAIFLANAGILQFIVGIIVGAAFAVGAFVLAFPAILVIVVSASSGAVAVVNGVLITLGVIKVPALNDGVFGSLLRYGWFTAIVAIVIAVAAILYQTRDVAKMAATMPTQSDYRY